MRILFATWPEVEYQAKVLTEASAYNRLVSYFFSKDMSRESFQSYAETGVGIYKSRKKVDPEKDARELAGEVEAVKPVAKKRVVEEDW